VYWINAAADSLDRQALERAFDEAALYSEESRTVSRPVTGRTPARFTRRATASPALVRLAVRQR
jgi:hypothetical protein